MAETLIVKPLGLVLQKAGLISLEQVKNHDWYKSSFPEVEEKKIKKNLEDRRIKFNI